MNGESPGRGRWPWRAGVVAIAGFLGPLLTTPAVAGDVSDADGVLRILAGGCVNCHGPGARGSGEIPPLAGRQAGELTRLLVGYRDQGGGVMHRLVGGYSDAELRALADHFSRLEP